MGPELFLSIVSYGDFDSVSLANWDARPQTRSGGFPSGRPQAPISWST